MSTQELHATGPVDPQQAWDAFHDPEVLARCLPGCESLTEVGPGEYAMTVTAERHWAPVEGDQVVASERRQGTFSRQLFLGDGLDTDQIHATYENGVLTVTVPVADRAKPRRIEVTSEAHKEAIAAAAG